MRRQFPWAVSSSSFKIFDSLNKGGVWTFRFLKYIIHKDFLKTKIIFEVEFFAQTTE